MNALRISTALLFLVLLAAGVKADEEPPAPPTIFELTKGRDDLSNIHRAIKLTDYDDEMKGSGPLTFFAPNNSAYDVLTAGQIWDFIRNRPKLTRLFELHVVEGTLTAADLASRESVVTLLGQPLTITSDGEKLRVGEATVIAADLEASNGVVHIIDAINFPAEE